MKKRIYRYFKHLFFTLIGLFIILIPLGLYHGATLHYADDPLFYSLENEGPYIFYEKDSVLKINYIKGNKERGFYVENKIAKENTNALVSCSFPLDSSFFNFKIDSNFQIPKAEYEDGEPILALSDIEGNFRTFRDFLIKHHVINKDLQWTFGKGHLVLVGDFVDRGSSVTQVLWFIYKLEQEAQQKGGMVHYILGNHELKNLQGHYQSTAEKYFAVAAILEKQPHELYGEKSFLGNWLASKNTLERINGNLFVHGGVHPKVVQIDLNIQQINELVRKKYYHTYFPAHAKNKTDLLLSNKTGLAWYRGYFKEQLTQQDIEGVLKKFQVKSVIVGHTLQSKVKQFFKGKVIAIDVKHPQDYQKNWPLKHSEGLLIKGNKYFRLLEDGSNEELLMD